MKNEECHCKQLQDVQERALEIFLPHDWHFPFNIVILPFSTLLQQLPSWFLPVFSYLFSMCEIGSRTSSVILKSIFIFNWTTDIEPCTFCRWTWDNAKALARFYQKHFNGKLETSSLCFKHQMVFKYTLKVTSI